MYREAGNGKLELKVRRFPHEDWEILEDEWQRWFVPNFNVASIRNLRRMYEGQASLDKSYARWFHEECQ